jgi:hypothetical protein
MPETPVRRLIVSNFYINRPQFVKVGAEGANEAASTDLGSVRSVEISFEADARFATAAKYRGAPVEGTIDAANGSINVVCEEMTEAVFEYLTGSTYDGTNDKLLVDGTGGDPVYLTVYIGDIPIQGVAHTFHAIRCIVDPSFSLSLGEDQMTVELPLKMLVNPAATGAKFYEFTAQA